MPNMRQDFARQIGLGDILDYQNQRPAQLGYTMGQHNGPQDAARHILGSYALANKIGGIPAAAVTTGYEGLGKIFLEPNKETSMDMHNNQLGRSLADRFDNRDDAERALKTLMDYAAKYDLWDKQVPYVPTWLPRKDQQGGY